MPAACQLDVFGMTTVLMRFCHITTNPQDHDSTYISLTTTLLPSSVFKCPVYECDVIAAVSTLFLLLLQIMFLSWLFIALLCHADVECSGKLILCLVTAACSKWINLSTG